MFQRAPKRKSPGFRGVKFSRGRGAPPSQTKNAGHKIITTTPAEAGVKKKGGGESEVASLEPQTTKEDS